MILISDLKKSLEIPEWFKEKKQSFIVTGTKNKKYTLSFVPDDSGNKKLVYKVYIGRTKIIKDKNDGELCIQWEDGKVANFRVFEEKNKIEIEIEDAIQIVKDICRRFNLPVIDIKIFFQRKQRGSDAEPTQDLFRTMHYYR